MEHAHSAGDVQPGTVTLCVEDGTRWRHLPVSADLWAKATESVRAGIVAVARDGFPSPTARLEVVSAEDVEPTD
ncbi:hypothetical protein C0R05_32465 [Streptomyces albidoflavus]|nr:hypothetical protein C0R05_32465 [Streptomyces albidoflavus]